MRNEFVLLKKKTTQGKYFWYFYYYHTDNGFEFTRSKRYSTKVSIDLKNENKSRREALKSARFIRQKKELERLDAYKQISTFKKYTENWFIIEKCPYLTVEVLRGGAPSRGWVDLQRSVLLKYLWPEFGNLKLNEISSSLIEAWIVKLKKENRLASRSINSYYSVLQTIMKEAYRCDHIPVNPCLRVKKLKVNSDRREILTLEEFDKIFSESSIHKIWDNKIMYYTAALIAGVCGLRMGEVQALRKSSVDLDKRLLTVDSSWGRQYGLKSTKTKESRIVPFPSYMKVFFRACHIFCVNDFLPHSLTI